MDYYIKTFKDIYQDEQNPSTLIWKKGEYYKVLKETERYVYCYNEYLNSLLESENNISLIGFLTKAWLNLNPIEKVKDRLPLNFIMLSEDEVKAEKDKNT